MPTWRTTAGGRLTNPCQPDGHYDARMKRLSEAIRVGLERLTGFLVVPRRLPPPFEPARILVTPSARLAYAFKPFWRSEPHLLDCARTLVRSGDVVWDVGANIGLFSFAAAALAGPQGQLFAFEPDLQMAGLLRRSAGMQSDALAKTTVISVAIGRAVALRKFFIARRARASNALAEYGSSQTGGVRTSEFVPTFPLDWLLTCLPPPDVLKIDVEGAEAEVLLNQHEMLAKVRPVIICEVAVTNSEALRRLFMAHSYVLYDGDRPLHGAEPVSTPGWNTVAVPQEKIELIAAAGWDYKKGAHS